MTPHDALKAAFTEYLGLVRVKRADGEVLAGVAMKALERGGFEIVKRTTTTET